MLFRSGSSEDKTTSILEDVFSHQDQCSWGIVAEEVVTDDFKEIQDIVATIVELHEPNLMVLSGGTGFAVSDVTPEVCWRSCRCRMRTNDAGGFGVVGEASTGLGAWNAFIQCGYYTLYAS